LLLVGLRYLLPPRLATVPVPDVVGLAPEQAKAKLARAGLTPVVRWSESGDRTLWNLVLQQLPSAGLRASRGETVVLLVYVREGAVPPTTPADEKRLAEATQQSAFLPEAGEGEEPPAGAVPAPTDRPAPAPYHFTGVPDVVGLSEQEARQRLRAVGLVLRVRGHRYSEWAEVGHVLKQTPPSGAGAPHDDLLRVLLSSGKSLRAPALVGLSERSAQRVLRTLGLHAHTDRHWSVARPGTVLASTPPTGKLLRPGATVQLVVSKGPPLPLTPAAPRPVSVPPPPPT
jgi:beta-lactam-binding protein with PASTA domain